MFPDPNTAYPLEGANHSERLCFLKNIIKSPQITVGDYTYYDDIHDVHNFEKNVLYLFEFMDDKLIIGNFCQIATGVRFLMNGANHAMSGISTYPFKAFGKAWQNAPMDSVSKGYTVVGHDVWIGNGATIMQGVKVGNGAIIGTNSLVTKDVEPYTIVGGNPAKLIRKSCDDDKIEFLQNLAWWNWDIEKITQNLSAIISGDFKALGM